MVFNFIKKSKNQNFNFTVLLKGKMGKYPWWFTLCKKILMHLDLIYTWT